MLRPPFTSQSTGRLSLFIVGLVLFSAPSLGQEIAWPVPGRAPDILLGVDYGLEAFDRYYAPMHQGTVYGGMRSSSGTYLLKILRGRRFGQSGFQGEIEAYPLLGRRMYAYASYAYGESPVFPRNRAGLELFLGLPSGFEASLGARYFGFPEGESVLLGTGSVSYYYKNFLFNLKPFLSLSTPRSGFSGVFQTRYYLSDNEEFVFGRIGAGFTPDERWIQTAQGIPGRELTLLQSQTIGAGVQRVVARRTMVTGRFDVTRQEVIFRPGLYVLDFTVGFGIRVLL